jgi:hypothetical protein
MKKQLFLTSAMASALLALPACSPQSDWNEDVLASNDTQVCVDREGRRVMDEVCERPRSTYYPYSWYYIGRSYPVPYYGDSIHDQRYAGRGSFTAQPGAFYDRAPVSTHMTRSQAVSRGGLGSSGRGFSSGRS